MEHLNQEPNQASNNPPQGINLRAAGAAQKSSKNFLICWKDHQEDPQTPPRISRQEKAYLASYVINQNRRKALTCPFTILWGRKPVQFLTKDGHLSTRIPMLQMFNQAPKRSTETEEVEVGNIIYHGDFADYGLNRGNDIKGIFKKDFGISDRLTWDGEALTREDEEDQDNEDFSNHDEFQNNNLQVSDNEQDAERTVMMPQVISEDLVIDGENAQGFLPQSNPVQAQPIIQQTEEQKMDERIHELEVARETKKAILQDNEGDLEEQNFIIQEFLQQININENEQETVPVKEVKTKLMNVTNQPK